MARGSGIEIFANIEFSIQTGRYFELTDEQVRQGIRPDPVTTYREEGYLRRAAPLYADGADGLYLFNNLGQNVPRSLGKLGDREEVRRWAAFEDRRALHSEIQKGVPAAHRVATSLAE